MQTQRSVQASASVPRTAVLVSADSGFRKNLAEMLTGMRWKVREASGGAEALWYLEQARSEALLLDSWLPDLDAEDLAEQLRIQYPLMDLICVNGIEKAAEQVQSARRNELLYALRRAQSGETPQASAGLNTIESLHSMAPRGIRSPQMHGIHPAGSFVNETAKTAEEVIGEGKAGTAPFSAEKERTEIAAELPGLLGQSAEMRKLTRSIRLVAPHKTTVLIEGPTGSGKELVARALHSLSFRSSKPFIVLNCAAIPESLLEAELFGHTRGAFTGAVQARTGRIEAAHGGTLFLDEIGEMPLALQAKLLRFLEAGELQRIGENEPKQVDVRVIAATHQPLVQRVSEEKFRPDLYFRLAVFPLQTPSLADRMEDVPMLAQHFLARLGENAPAKTLDPDAMKKLVSHTWPGNVRELAHVVERAYIFAEDRPQITVDEISFT